MNPYQPPATPPVEPRPAPPAGGLTSGVIAIAVTEIFFGGMGLLGAPIALALRGLAHDPVSVRIQEITWEGTMGTWMRASLVIGAVLGAVLLASGIGILKRRAWARRAGIAYAGAAIVMQLAGQVVNFTVLFPALEQLSEEYHANRAARAVVMGGWIGGIAGGLFAFVLPTAILVVLTRPSVKAQLAA